MIDFFIKFYEVYKQNSLFVVTILILLCLMCICILSICYCDFNLKYKIDRDYRLDCYKIEKEYEDNIFKIIDSIKSIDVLKGFEKHIMKDYD